MKADNGTLNLNNFEYYTGATTVNGGTLFLGGGAANTLAIAVSNTAATAQNLVVNSGTLNLNGFDQAVGTISNDDTVGGTGGTITSSTAANFISNTATNSTTFGGVFGGAISFYKAGTTVTTTLTSADTYSGSTNVLGGVLLLQDSGTLTSTTINVNGATLSLVNNGLSNNNARTAASTRPAEPGNGGTINLTGSNQASTAEMIGASANGLSLLQGREHHHRHTARGRDQQHHLADDRQYHPLDGRRGHVFAATRAARLDGDRQQPGSSSITLAAAPQSLPVASLAVGPRRARLPRRTTVGRPSARGADPQRHHHLQ